MAASCGVSAADGLIDTSAFLDHFRNPPRHFGPWARWWWSGADVTAAGMERDLAGMAEAGFAGAEIQPFTFLLGADGDAAARVFGYGSEDYRQHLAEAASIARGHDLQLDYTFGSGWPFGGIGAVTPELSLLELKQARTTVRGPLRTAGRLTLPWATAPMLAPWTNERLPQGWAERLAARERLVAVVALRGVAPEMDPHHLPAGSRVARSGSLDIGSALILTDKLRGDGSLDWVVPDGEWQIFVFKQFAAGERTGGTATIGPKLILDHFSRTAFDAYAAAVGGTARAAFGSSFGDTVRAIFCDSLELHPEYYWCENFLAAFRTRAGYDLTPWLPVLRQPGRGVANQGFHGPPEFDAPDAERVRHDYWTTVSALMIENFFEPLSTWAHAHGVRTKIQAHGAPVDLLAAYGLADIPETETLWDGGRRDFQKLASSAARLGGRSLVSCESFVWAGEAFETTPEKIKRTADALFTAGVNQIGYHGYLTDYPAQPGNPFAVGSRWLPFGVLFSDAWNAANPFWRDLPQVNRYIARTQFILQQGERVAPVALYQAALPYQEYQPPDPEPLENGHLAEHGFDFDHINEALLIRATPATRGFLSHGGAHFDALVLVNQQRTSEELARILELLAMAGVPILFVGAVPSEAIGYRDHASATLAIRTVVARMRILPNVRFVPRADGVAAALIELGVQPNLRFQDRHVPFVHRRLVDRDCYFLHNPVDEPVAFTISCRSAGTPLLLDPWTGSVATPEYVRRTGECQVRLALEPLGSCFVDFAARLRSAASRFRPPSAFDAMVLAPTGWSIKATGRTAPDREADIEVAVTELADLAADPRLRHFSGSIEYRATIRVEARWAQAKSVFLDLGPVFDVAEGTLNGHPLPPLPIRPFRWDATGLLRFGDNDLVITVRNALRNAMVQHDWTIPGFPAVKASPRTTGLLGPLRLLRPR